MAGLLLLVFLIVPIIELYVMVQVGGLIGVLPTIGLLVVFSVAGVWLVKYEGLGVWARFRRQIEQGVVPTNEIIDGFLILLAGALLVVPGFVTDFIGLLLLIPPTRALVRKLIAHRYRSRLQIDHRSATAAPASTFRTPASTTSRTSATSPRPSGEAARPHEASSRSDHRPAARRGNRDARARRRRGGVEVFMLRRNLNSDFVGGAYVFPGGAVDDHDRHENLDPVCRGRSDAEASDATRHRLGRSRLLGGRDPRVLRGGRRAARLRPRRRSHPARRADHEDPLRRSTGAPSTPASVASSRSASKSSCNWRSTTSTTSATGSPPRVRPAATTPVSSSPRPPRRKSRSTTTTR